MPFFRKICKRYLSDHPIRWRSRSLAESADDIRRQGKGILSTARVIISVNVIWTAGGRCGKMWEALVNGLYKTLDLGYATVEAVEAGHSPSHGTGSAV